MKKTNPRNIFKWLNFGDKEKILKVVREQKINSFREKKVNKIADVSSEIMKTVKYFKVLH